MRWSIVLAALGIGAFAALMALRAQTDGTGARAVLAALAFACLGAVLAWVIGRARKGPPLIP
jgi:membrane protein DedA with SNARE-associated domain